MIRFLQKLCSKRWFPILWTLFTIFLLCLPGKDIPSKGLFSIEGLDKIAHVCLFGGIVLFWGFYLRKSSPREQFRRQILWSVVLTTLLGIGLEFLQRYAIPNRSFDVWDIVADFSGAAAAGFFHIFWAGIREERA